MALNVTGAWGARFFAFPLYLDSFATVSVAYGCGLLPGLLVALLTNLVMTLHFGTPPIFMTCHVMTALGAWLVFTLLKEKRDGFSKDTYATPSNTLYAAPPNKAPPNKAPPNKTPSKKAPSPTIDLFLLAGLLSTLTNGTFGSIYSLTMYGGETEAAITPFLMYIYRTTGSMPLSIFWSGFVTNLADKSLSAMIAYLLVLSVTAKKTTQWHFSALLNRSYIVTSTLIILAVMNIVSCFTLQKSYRNLSGTSAELDTSVYIMILASIVLLAASFMIVYAQMVQTKKEMELDNQKRQLQQNLAFDLHDGVLQNLVALNASLESQLKTGETSSQIQFIKSATSEIRFLCGLLRLNDDVPFEESLHHTIDAYEKTYGFKITLGIATELSDLDSNQKVEILRILYECLSNTARHSTAKHVSVTFTDDGKGTMYFTVRDDGIVENDAPTPKAFHGLGLASIQTCVENIGGTVEFLQTEEGWTTRIILHI